MKITKMASVRIIAVLFSGFILASCIHHKEIMRPDEKRAAVSFSSEQARSTFTCTFRQIEARHPWDKKQKESTSADLLFINLYQKDYFLSESAYFNSIVDKADLNRDLILTKSEVISLYKLYFPNDRYVQIGSGDGYLKQAQARMVTPRCDIHPED